MSKCLAVLDDCDRYRWLKKRERFASVSVDFNKDFSYKCHRITFHMDGIGWIDAEGQSIDEAVDAAILLEAKFRANPDWQEAG